MVAKNTKITPAAKITDPIAINFLKLKEVEEAKVDSSPDDAIEELLLSSIAVLLLLPSLGLIVVPLIIMAADSGVVIVGISLQLKSEFLLLF